MADNTKTLKKVGIGVGIIVGLGLIINQFFKKKKTEETQLVIESIKAMDSNVRAEIDQILNDMSLGTLDKKFKLGQVRNSLESAIKQAEANKIDIQAQLRLQPMDENARERDRLMNIVSEANTNIFRLMPEFQFLKARLGMELRKLKNLESQLDGGFMASVLFPNIREDIRRVERDIANLEDRIAEQQAKIDVFTLERDNASLNLTNFDEEVWNPLIATRDALNTANNEWNAVISNSQSLIKIIDDNLLLL